MRIPLITRSWELLLNPVDFRSQEVKEARLEKKYLKKNKPQPLPYLRIHITQEHIAAHPDEKPPPPRSTASGHSTQALPPLLRLPAELRLQIFELVTGGQIIHLLHLPRQIKHICFPSTSLAETPLPPHQPPQYNVANRRFLSTTGLPLLLTCHSIYYDTIDILYSSNTFSLNDLNVLLFWNDLPLLRRQRLQSIRRLSIQWVYYSDPGQSIGLVYEPYDFATWRRFWQIVAGEMIGLRQIELALEYVGTWQTPKAEQSWVKPTMGVKGMQHVSISLLERRSPWDKERCGEVEKVVEDAWKRPR